MFRAARHQTMSRERRLTWCQTSSRLFTHSRSGRWASQAPFQAPIETPTMKSGTMSRSIRARNIPTCAAPRAPPPEIANAVLSRPQRSMCLLVYASTAPKYTVELLFGDDDNARLLYFEVTRAFAYNFDDQRVPITQGGGLLDCQISSFLRTRPPRRMEAQRRWRSSSTRRKLQVSA